jgi:hypothetical protein
MGVSACQVCDKCGSTLSGHPDYHADPKPHNWKVLYDDKTGKPYLWCSDCGTMDKNYRLDNPLLQALKKAYRKHVLNDDSIGWDELGDIMHDAISNDIGDDEFIKWVEDMKLFKNLHECSGEHVDEECKARNCNNAEYGCAIQEPIGGLNNENS